MARSLLPLVVVGAVLVGGCDTSDTSAPSPPSAAAAADTTHHRFSVPPSGVLDVTYTFESDGQPVAHRVGVYDANSTLVAYFRYVPSAYGVRVSAAWPGVDAHKASMRLFKNVHDPEPVYSQTVHRPSPETSDQLSAVLTPGGGEANLGWAEINGGSIHIKPGDIRVDNEPKGSGRTRPPMCWPPFGSPVSCTAYGLGFAPEVYVPRVSYIALIGPPEARATVHTVSVD